MEGGPEAQEQALPLPAIPAPGLPVTAPGLPVTAPVEKKVPPAIPYDDATAAQIKTFYRLKTTKPEQYRIGDDGALNIYAKDGTLQSSIKLKPYRPITTEERSIMEQYRSDKLAGLDLIYEQERRKLIKALGEYKAGGSLQAVILANERVTQIELERVHTRSGVRTIKQIPIPKTNEVIFDEPYEQRKLFGAHNFLGNPDPLVQGIYALERRNFPTSLFYGRYDDSGVVVEAETVSIAEGSASVRLANGLTARLFYRPEDPQNGTLSPLWPVKFVHKRTQTEFACAFQAYEAERMAEQGLEAVRAKILKTRSPRGVAIHTVKYTTPAKNPKALWTEILTDAYDQNPRLIESLLATGQDSLVYADPRLGGGGVGLGADDTKILDPVNWKSENLVGKVLESLRANFREGVSEAPAPEAKERVISEEEQAAAKKAAIIRNRMR
jgi:predicted NAD-dependent protein-ADP-ribosyltransferase YbiA (DUF1768 family)